MIKKIKIKIKRMSKIIIANNLYKLMINNKMITMKVGIVVMISYNQNKKN
jgi:hypothetical protein